MCNFGRRLSLQGIGCEQVLARLNHKNRQKDAYQINRQTMAQSTSQKLRIREGMTLKTVDAPKDFETELGELPTGVAVFPAARKFDQVHWFVRSQAELAKGLPEITGWLTGTVVCWIYYPKLSSGIKTDLRRDTGWDMLMKENFKWLSMVSFNDTWTAFGIRQKTEADKLREEKPRERPGSEFIDPEAKSVLLPDDVKKLFLTHKTEARYFDTLAFSHRREYIEWIEGAKRQETREQRLEKMMTMLSAQKKNPASR